MDEDRRRRRATFDTAADRYDRARPDYPDELFDALVSLARLRPGDRLLEIGCATGKATRPLAQRGFRITSIELGASLAALARRNLAGYRDVEVIEGAFEDWDPAATEPFDLVFAATAWHWVDPEVRYQRAWETLRPGGHLAVWSATDVFPAGGDPFFREIQDVYEEIGEGLPPGFPWSAPGELPDERDEIDRTGLFAHVEVRHVDWETTYDADGYLELLDTSSGHITMQPWQRKRLYGEIRRRLAARTDGTLRRHWGAVLHVAERVS